MRRQRGMVFAVAVGLAVPAHAQLASENLLARQTYTALTRSGDVRNVSALLRNSLISVGAACTHVVSYQLFRQTETAGTLKVGCANRPVYLLTIDVAGRMLVDGGDGRIAAMNPADGVIVEVPAGEARSPNPAAMAAEFAVAAPETPLGWMRWLFALMALLVAMIAFTIYRAFMISEAVAVVGPAVPHQRYTSEDKDRLVAEARRLATDFWAHPSGIHIVRSRNGKRRLFPSWGSAQAYRIWGVRIRQVR